MRTRRCTSASSRCAAAGGRSPRRPAFAGCSESQVSEWGQVPAAPGRSTAHPRNRNDYQRGRGMKHTPDPAQGELFVCDIANWPVKDDIASMEVPIFRWPSRRTPRRASIDAGRRWCASSHPALALLRCSTKDLLLYIAFADRRGAQPGAGRLAHGPDREHRLSWARSAATAGLRLSALSTC